jgi:hypothetical protein
MVYNVRRLKMIPLSREDLQSGIVRAWATDMLTGETQELTTRDGSACQFFEAFKCGGYKIQLRLDWKDLDSLGNPTLDADFSKPCTGKKVKPKRVALAHHTQAQGDGKRTYIWESRKLRVTLNWSESMNEEANLVDFCSNILTRDGEEVPSLVKSTVTSENMGT